MHCFVVPRSEHRVCPAGEKCTNNHRLHCIRMLRDSDYNSDDKLDHFTISTSAIKSVIRTFRSSCIDFSRLQQSNKMVLLA